MPELVAILQATGNTPLNEMAGVCMGSGMGSSLGLAPFNKMQELLILPGDSRLECAMGEVCFQKL